MSAESKSTGALVANDLANRCAETTQRAFLEYQARFNAITRRARELFLARDWAASFDDAADRLHFYNDVLDDLTDRIKDLMGAHLKKHQAWARTKLFYS